MCTEGLEKLQSNQAWIVCGTNLMALHSQRKAQWLKMLLENVRATVQLEISLGKHCKILIFLKAGAGLKTIRHSTDDWMKMRISVQCIQDGGD